MVELLLATPLFLPFVTYWLCYEVGEIGFRGEEKWIYALKARQLLLQLY